MVYTPTNPTQLTPPRVALLDPRSGAISREWYRFFLTLLTATQTNQNESALAPDATSLLASYIAAAPDAVAPSEGVLAALVADLQEQITALQMQTPLVPSEPEPPSWMDLVAWPSVADGTSTVAGQPGAVRRHSKIGQSDIYRFIPTVYDAALDAFYTTFSGGVLTGLICTRG